MENKKVVQKSIAEAMGVSESTVSRELKRNGVCNDSYNFMKAHEKSMCRCHRELGNRAKFTELVWRVRRFIVDEQRFPTVLIIMLFHVLFLTFQQKV